MDGDVLTGPHISSHVLSNQGWCMRMQLGGGGFAPRGTKEDWVKVYRCSVAGQDALQLAFSNIPHSDGPV